MVELVVSCIMLSVVAVVLVPGIRAVNKQRKAIRYETMALIELHNLAAKLASGQPTTAVALTESFAERFSDTELAVVHNRDSGSTNITITRYAAAAKPNTTRSLTVWAPEKVVGP